MKNKMIYAFAALLFAAPGVLQAESGQRRGEGDGFRAQLKADREAHRQQQASENKAFRDSLQGKTPEEQQAAIKAHRETQHRENVAFAAEQTEKRRVFLTQRLAANTKLTDAQKADLIAFYESQWKENDAFRESRYEENVAFLEKIAADTSLTQEQKKAAIQAHREQAKAATQAHHAQQRAENQAKRDGLK